MQDEFFIEARSGQSIDVKENQSITVIDLEGGQVVDFFAEAFQKSDEFLSTGVTIDCNESLRMGIGSIIYTNLYRPMFQLVADDVGEHDFCTHAAGRKCLTSSTTMEKSIRIVLTILTPA